MLHGTLCGRLAMWVDPTTCATGTKYPERMRFLGKIEPSPWFFLVSLSHFFGLCEPPIGTANKGKSHGRGYRSRTLLLSRYDEILQIPTIHTKASILVSAIRFHPSARRNKAPTSMLRVDPKASYTSIHWIDGCSVRENQSSTEVSSTPSHDRPLYTGTLSVEIRFAGFKMHPGAATQLHLSLRFRDRAPA